MRRIRIAGAIVPNELKWIYDWFEMECFCINDLRKELTDENEELEIEINSPGGSVFVGSEIYSVLKKHKGNVTIHIVGLAASIASVIAMAGDKTCISPTAEFMIHNVTAKGSGDYRDMAHLSEVLEKSNSTLANAYVLKTGLQKDEILEMMNKETWLTPEEAKEKGFVDEILFDVEKDDFKLVAGISEMFIPENIIHKMMIDREQEELNLLRLKEI